MRFLRDHFVKRAVRNANTNEGDASRVGKQSCCTSGFTEAGRLAPICACFLMPLCPYVSRVSGCQITLRRQPLYFLRPPGR